MVKLFLWAHLYFICHSFLGIFDCFIVLMFMFRFFLSTFLYIVALLCFVFLLPRRFIC